VHDLTFWAHSANGDGQGVWEPLRQHLQNVADRAASFASVFHAGEQARLAGLLHDLGKYADRFQDYLAGKVARAGDHWSAGAFQALLQARKLGVVPAMAILAHHACLEYLEVNLKRFALAIKQQLSSSERVTESNYELLLNRFIHDGLTLPQISDGISVESEHAVSAMLDARMLFSALVDADFLETEAHFNGDAHQPRVPRPAGPPLDHDKAIEAFERFVQSLRQNRRDDPLTPLREQLQETCRQRANDPQGIYTLSAPTGLGKTLAMLAFALYHAKRHNLRRIILVMPYINIIDQTASVYRAIFSSEQGFSEGFILEHHSLADDSADGKKQEEENEKDLRRLLAENWDAPIILTTNVQFFESLFANRPSQCRKLHQIARSVVLFDEVQTIPTRLAVATLAAIARLTQPDGPYGVTAVFATATQPAFTVLHERVRKHAPSGWQPKEIVSDVATIFQATAERVHITWRDEEPTQWESLADELATHRQALCIVNLKRHATALFEALSERLAESEKPSLLHISTNLCPLHRREVLAEINRRLRDDEPVRLVATQCVEAGVDLDFPVVYRALGPLEAIAQAAGRCNRHGKRKSGQLIVFQPALEENGTQRLYPPGYEEAVSATDFYIKQLRARDPTKLGMLLSDPAGIADYYMLFYKIGGYTDPTTKLRQEKDLLDAIDAGDFEKVAESYRLINKNAVHVLVPYQPKYYQELLDKIREEKGKTGFLRNWIREATWHSVDIFRPKEDSPVWNYLQPIEFFSSRRSSSAQTNWYYLLPSVKYDEKLGLVFSDDDVSFVV